VKTIRVLPETGWTGVDNFAARSRRLSWRAKGLLLELLSYPQTNDITIAKLAGWAAESRKAGYVAEGREALQMAMRELEREGYVAHVKRRNKRGRWESTTYVCAVPEALSQVVPSTASPRPVDQPSVDQWSVDQQSASQSLSTYKTDEKMEKKTEDQEAGLQYSSALAAARAGKEAARKDRLRADLQGWYDAADKLDAERLRRHLLAFERKRPMIYRQCRNAAIGQIGGQQGGKALLAGSSGVRATDLLSFKYALQHYAEHVPSWLVKLPIRNEG
jgi:hypothetical protein